VVGADAVTLGAVDTAVGNDVSVCADVQAVPKITTKMSRIICRYRLPIFSL
jgi:hypothetical protein